ncbi:hypothetical protein YC2023_118059 [Brassica napus]
MLNPQDINRVRLLLHHCSDLETLTFDLLPPSSIMSGCEHEPVLERIELYMPYRLEESQWMIAYEGVQRSVEPVQSLRKNEILVIL